MLGRQRIISVSKSDGSVVCAECVLADTPLRRLRGLLGTARLAPGEGILLRPAPAIHTFFMRFPIDAAFLDRDGVVLEIRRAMKPWRMAACRGARAVLELGAGEASVRNILRGDRLVT